MHRLVVYSMPVEIDGQMIYGRFLGGEDEGKIFDDAIKEYTELLTLMAWKDRRGDEYRKKRDG